ncbi:MAG: energy transducer TonB [Blastocatellia bacterium]
MAKTQPKRRFVALPILLAVLGIVRAAAFAQSPVRLAVLDLAGDEGGRMASILREEAAKETAVPFDLLDQTLVRRAVEAAGFNRLPNLSLDEARALGQGLGCDFFISGKVLVTKRLGAGEESHFDALAGIFLVEARTGALAHFAFELARSREEAGAQAALEDRIRARWPEYARQILAARQRHAEQVERIAGPPPAPAIEILLDDRPPAGLDGPVFFQRLKPPYTEQADLADVAATVELDAAFLDDGRIGDVVVTRWAGFGLDESAIATVRKLTFKPAELNGKVVTIRGLVRYTFRRPQAQAPRPADPGEIDRLKRSLRNLKTTGKIPDPHPNF